VVFSIEDDDMSSSPRFRIVIADDHAVVRAGLRSLLDRQGDMTVVGEAASADALVDEARRLQPDVVVTDLRMPKGGVLEAIRTLTGERPALRVVVFTGFDETSDAVRAFRVGAAAYVLKQGSEDTVLTAIRRVMAGRRYCDEPLAARMMQELLDAPVEDPLARIALLSDRETAVLELVSRGYTGPEIARQLGVRVGTVESYRHRIRQKLGLRSRAEVTEFARASGYLWRDRR
jgi:DNA-binding NarL/FixJ family response regulator